MNRPDGTPVNAVYGFTTMIMKLIEDEEPDHIAVIFDKGRKTFRNDIYPDYKANRPPPPDDLIPQFALIRNATRALGLASVDKEGFEADDLIATYARLAREAGVRVTIVSSDKDLMQLVGPGVTMRDPMSNRLIGPAEVEEKFGVGPERVIDVQALAGDSTDNVPGVPGIGVKTAALLIREYGNLDTLLQRAGEIKQPKRRQALTEQADAARMSRDLVTLRDDVEVEAPITSFAHAAPDLEVLLGFLKEQAFRSLTAKVESREGAGDGTAPAGGTAAYELVQTAESLQAWIDEARAGGLGGRRHRNHVAGFHAGPAGGLVAGHRCRPRLLRAPGPWHGLRSPGTSAGPASDPYARGPGPAGPPFAGPGSPQGGAEHQVRHAGPGPARRRHLAG